MSGKLIITDGTTSIDLLNSFSLVEWTPATAASKGGGTWSQSPFSQGRQLVLHEYDNIVDTFELVAKGYGSIDSLIRSTQDLRRLLEKAIAFWVSDWADEPVWIETRGICETNTRYSVIHAYRTPGDDNPFSSSSPVITSTIFEGFDLILEHGLWLENEPGTGTSVEIGAYTTYDSRNLGNVDSSGDPDPTTATDEVFVTNHDKVCNLTDVYRYDVSIPGYSVNLLGAGVPYDLYPAVPAVNDMIYFGIDSALADDGPFTSLVFDLSTAQTGITGITWEYYDNGVMNWQALTVQDNTNAGGAMTGVAFDTTGCNSVTWHAPTSWSPIAINGVNCWWVRARITAVGAPTPPTQQNRNVYSVSWPYTDVDELQIGGDVPALLKITLDNPSSQINVAFNYPQVHRVLMSSRSVSRGSDFTPFINISDVQNDPGITLAFSATAPVGAYVPSPTGRCATDTPPAVLGNAFSITFDDTISDQYLGRFRLFLRAYESGVGSAAGDYSAKVTIYANNMPIFESDEKVSGAVYNIFDFGQINFPSDYGQRTWDSIVISVDTVDNVGGGYTVYWYDAILWPVDEWAGDFSTEYVSGVNGVNNSVGLDSNDKATQLEADSVTNPKQKTQAPLVQIASGNLNDIYVPITNDPVSLAPNKSSRIWFLTMFYLAASPTNWSSNYDQSSRIQMIKNQQYLGMRGDR